MDMERLDGADLGVINAALDLLGSQGDWQQGEDIRRLREKLDRMGVANLVPWGHALTDHLMKQIDLVAEGARALDDFIREIDTGYPDGRDEQRTAFLQAVKDLARKVAADNRLKRKKA